MRRNEKVRRCIEPSIQNYQQPEKFNSSFNTQYLDRGYSAVNTKNVFDAMLNLID